MNKTGVLAAFSSVLILVLPAAAQSQPHPGSSLGLRLYGGLNYLTADEFNRGLAGRLELWRYAAQVEGLSGVSRFSAARWGFDAGAEMLIPLGSRVSVQLGVAAITASARSEANFTPQDLAPSSQEMEITPRAVSFQAGLCYLLPLSPRLEARIQAGAAYYLARPEAEYRREWEGYWEKDRYTLKSGGFGFQGGAGLELRLNRWLAIFLEGRARYGRLSNFSGSLETTSSEEGQTLTEGELYAFNYRLAEGVVFSLVDILAAEPSGPAFSKVGKGVVDFSGFSLNLGLVLKF